MQATGSSMAEFPRRSTMLGLDGRRRALSSHAHHTEHDAAVTILKKSKFERNPEEVKLLFQYMRKIVAFAKLSDFLLNQLCVVLNYQALPADRAVFR